MKYTIDQFEQINLYELPRYVGRNNGDIILGKGNYLWAWDGTDCTTLEIPEWLADGIRELVKNKIEQDKTDTVSQE